MRIKKELDNIKAQPIPNINIYSNDSNLTKLNAQFYNLKDTPYENGKIKFLQILINFNITT